jgi:hypothetical protein
VEEVSFSNTVKLFIAVFAIRRGSAVEAIRDAAFYYSYIEIVPELADKYMALAVPALLHCVYICNIIE